MKVELNDDSLPKGTEYHVEGLGTLVNGKSVEFDKEAVTAFEERTGQTVAEAFKENANVSLSGEGSRTTKEGGES
jgi:hypothetical protein